MESVWGIYYDHFARENNHLRYLYHVKKCEAKVIELLASQTRWGIFCRSCSSKEEIIRKIKKKLGSYLTRIEDNCHRIYILSELADLFCPNQTPKEKEFLILGFDLLEVVNGRLDRKKTSLSWYWNPTEKRLYENTGKPNSFLSSDISAERSHRLDAILALM